MPKESFSVVPNRAEEKPRGLSEAEFEAHWRAEEKRWGTSELLTEKLWNHKVSAVLRPEGVSAWSPETRAAYLETMGRFFASMGPFTWTYQGLPLKRHQSEEEYRRLVERLGADESTKAEGILRLGAMFSAHQRNTNTSGHLEERCTGPLEKARQDYEAEGDRESAELLVNPFRLEPGTKLLRFDQTKKQIASESVLDMELKGLGTIIGPANGEDGTYRGLADLNHEISSGDWTTGDADNVFGGREQLDEIFAPFEVGAEFELDTSPLLSHEKTHETACVVGSNRAELEQQYGSGWMAFAARNEGIFKVDVEANGEVHKGIDFHRVKIYVP
jgi:hypothetical protein